MSQVSDEEFIRLFRSLGASGAAKELGINVRAVYSRRARLEGAIDAPISNPNNKVESERFFCGRYPARLPIEIKNGIALIGSDCHYYPGVITPAHRGFVRLAKEFGKELKLVCMNGDVKDGASNSRHAPLGWEEKPSVRVEIETVEDRLTEVEDASRGAFHLWNLGNHDMRFEAKLAAQIPEYKGVKGFSLTDHFPRWKMAISAWVNDDVVVKHRFKGGVHATHNNTLYAGRTICTGHLHSLKITPFDDYDGTRWGVDSGTLADPYGDHASYGEDNPVNHRSGFIVLTFHHSRLLWPEIAAVMDEKHIQFRGQVIEV